jgi:hypothetical protein
MRADLPLIELIQAGIDPPTDLRAPRIEAVVFAPGGLNPALRTLDALAAQTLATARTTLILPPGTAPLTPTAEQINCSRILTAHVGNIGEVLTHLLVGNDADMISIYLGGDLPNPESLEILAWFLERSQRDFVLCGPNTATNSPWTAHPFELPPSSPAVSRTGLFRTDALRNAGGWPGMDLLEEAQCGLIENMDSQRGGWVRIGLCTQWGSKPRPAPSEENQAAHVLQCVPPRLPRGHELEWHCSDYPIWMPRPGERHVMWMLPNLSIDEAHGALPTTLAGLKADGIQVTVVTTEESDHRFAPRLRGLADGVFHLPHFLNVGDRLTFVCYLLDSRHINRLLVNGAGWSRLALPVLKFLRPELTVQRNPDLLTLDAATRAILKQQPEGPGIYRRQPSWKLEVDRYAQWMRSKGMEERWAAHARVCVPQQNELLLWRSLWPPSKLYPWLAKRFGKHDAEDATRRLLRRS